MDLIDEVPDMAQALRQGVLPAAASRYRRILTWASAVSFVSILVIFWVWFPKDESRLLGVLLLLPVLLPYAFIPLRVYRQRLRSGLILAMVMGCAVFVPGICLIWFAFRWDRGWWLLCSLILMTILQPVLVVTALACFESWESSLISLPMSHQQPFRLKLLAAPLYGLLLIIVFSQLYSPVPSYISENESSAMYYLCAALYAADIEAFDTKGLHRGLYVEVSYFASYSFFFWFPTMLKRQSGFSDVNVGLLGVVPYFVLFFAMQVNGWHSDKTRERHWHSAVPLFVAAAGFMGLVAQARSIPLSLLFFTMACVSSAFLPTFWAIPTEILSQSTAAAAVGMINSVGKIAGFASPYLFGYLNTRTGSFSYGLAVLMFSALAGGLLILCAPRTARGLVR